MPVLDLNKGPLYRAISKRSKGMGRLRLEEEIQRRATHDNPLKEPGNLTNTSLDKQFRPWKEADRLERQAMKNVNRKRKGS